MQIAQDDGTPVAGTTEKRIKWLGVHWGLGPPVINIVLGIVMIVPNLGFLALTVLFPQTSGPSEGETSLIQTLMWIGMLSLFALIGVVAIINGYFGLKLARMRREGNRYA